MKHDVFAILFLLYGVASGVSLTVAISFYKMDDGLLRKIMILLFMSLFGRYLMGAIFFLKKMVNTNLFDSFAPNVALFVFVLLELISLLLLYSYIRKHGNGST